MREKRAHNQDSVSDAGFFPTYVRTYGGWSSSLLEKNSTELTLISHVSKTLTLQSLITTYNSFARPHLDYGDVLYDLSSNKNLCKKMRVFNTLPVLPSQVLHIRCNSTLN